MLLLFLIGGIQKSTLIDFPEKIASIVFTQGCNFRCGYCHNSELISFQQYYLDGQEYNIEDFFSFLERRVGKLDGVVITGGEPTLQTGLYDFIKRVKSMGFEIKLDTNGSNPDYLNQLILDNMLDYIAMDIKAPLDKYPLVTNVTPNTEKIQKSIDLIMHCGVKYEFRTTVLKSQLSLDDFEQIGQLINGAEKYFLQKFVSSKIFDEKLKDETTYTNEEFSDICKILQNYVKHVAVR